MWGSMNIWRPLTLDRCDGSMRRVVVLWGFGILGLFHFGVVAFGGHGVLGL